MGAAPRPRPQDNATGVLWWVLSVCDPDAFTPGEDEAAGRGNPAGYAKMRNVVLRCVLLAAGCAAAGFEVWCSAWASAVSRAACPAVSAVLVGVHAPQPPPFAHCYSLAPAHNAGRRWDALDAMLQKVAEAGGDAELYRRRTWPDGQWWWWLSPGGKLTAAGPQLNNGPRWTKMRCPSGGEGGQAAGAEEEEA